MKHKGSIHVHTLKKLQIQEVEKKSLYSCQIVDSMFIFPESYSLPNPLPVIYTYYKPDARHTFQSFLIPCIIKPFGGCSFIGIMHIAGSGSTSTVLVECFSNIKC